VATRFFGAAAVAGNVVLAGGELELEPLVDVDVVGAEDVVDVVVAGGVVVVVDDVGGVDVVVELDEAGGVDVVVEVDAAPVA
jgi:hypothetical protein